MRRAFVVAKICVFANSNVQSSSNMSSRGATFATWGSAGKHHCKKVFTRTYPIALGSVPPTCLHDNANYSNHFPDRPPLTVKGVVVL